MEELQMRRLSKAQVFLKQERTRLINHLHALFVSDGITSMSKRLLATGKSRRMAVKRLTPLHETLASQILSVIDEVEVRLSEIGDLIKGMLEGHPDEATILLSIPGVGPMTAAAFLAYIGDGSRFANASQVSNFAGLVPRIDSSGETTRYGHITRSGNSIIRRAAVQAAWAAIRSYAGGVFRETFERIKARRGSSIAIVAIARRIVELMYSLLKSGELYRYGSEEDRLRKLRRYKMELVGTGGLDATT
jgi:transposase